MAVAASVITAGHFVSTSQSFTFTRRRKQFHIETKSAVGSSSCSSSLLAICRFPQFRASRGLCVMASLTPKKTFNSSTKLYISGLSFRTTEESLRNAFQNFGQLVEVNLVMDKIANRPRGFAFLRYETEEESQKAIDGMHGKFLDGRVIFVEVAKPRSEVRQSQKQNPTSY